MSTTEYRLLTVNAAPERAAPLLARVIDEVKDKYTIVHVGNVEKIEDVKAAVKKEKPNALFTSSMWTAEQAKEINDIAKGVQPGIQIINLPQGLQGPDAVVAYIKENLPA